MAVARPEVCPWCKKRPVTMLGPLDEPTCRECLGMVRSARCRCGSVVEPEMGLYHVSPDGSVTCCFCLGSVRCGNVGCGGCDVCMPPSEDVACHWCGAVECRNCECQAGEECLSSETEEED